MHTRAAAFERPSALFSSLELQPPAQEGPTLRSIFVPLLRPEDKILMLGCGNSNMSAQER